VFAKNETTHKLLSQQFEKDRQKNLSRAVIGSLAERKEALILSYLSIP
jgi:hypothetical protein